MALSRVDTDMIVDDAITSAKIDDETIVPADVVAGQILNVKVNSSAAIVTSKLSGAVTGIASHGVGTVGFLNVGTSANNIVQLDSTPKLPAVSGTNLTNLTSANLTGALPAISGTNLTNLSAANLTGALPALNGSNLTNLTSANLVGALPALNGSALTYLPSANLVGALPALDGSALTGVPDTTGTIQNNLGRIAMRIGAIDQLVKFNMIDQVIDDYEDTSGVNASASTNETRAGSAGAYYYHGANSNMTLISETTTAQAAPSQASIVFQTEDAAGTVTVNTDLKAYVSRNAGTGWDQATIAKVSTWGSGNVYAANNVAFSNSASGTAMRYKIETLNQSGARVTRIYGTSLAWS